MVPLIKNIPNFSLRFLSMASGALMITAGILNVFNLFQIVINLYIICSGVLLILCDIKTFTFYRYIEFLFTVVGRSLYILIIASIIINKGLLSLLIGLILIVIAAMYVTLGYYNGIPIPLMDKRNCVSSFPDQKNNARSTCSMETTDGFN
ncbi:COPI associated protein, putative [Plasmodium malariae]|uniref:COPI associated protein, putative n=1 Tax=Plasmodium malariae TaxID=5858 RepID=A0A1C3L3D9_PLAMA|nr:COPI associated protein, putative [Plasmodium malariae]SBT81061.1 COPI associated protein, putative [Plasmodium malariae]SCP03662.1 COPI associated protein, putative [Plasmodium malariae]